MEKKDPKAMQEVWEWKEKLSKEINELPEGERLKHIIEKAKDTIEKLKAKRKSGREEK